MTIHSTVEGAVLDAFAPPDVRENWTCLAVMLERRAVELAYLVARLQEAYAAHAVASHKASDRGGDDWTNELDDALREASGFERLTVAVQASGLWPAVEARKETAEEKALYDAWQARRGGGE